jgi:hypothetical protein
MVRMANRITMPMAAGQDHESTAGPKEAMSM